MSELTAWWNLLTLVITTSPVPSNPDTSVLRLIMSRWRLVPDLPRCAKLIQFDGANPRLPADRLRAYDGFKREVRELVRTDADFARTALSMSDELLFASHNLAAAVHAVNTTYMLVSQHDYVLTRPFDARNLLRTMAAVPTVRHVRLNVRANVARGFDSHVVNFTGPSVRVPLSKTCGWSDVPHVTTRRYYLDVAIPNNRGDHDHGKHKFMEESNHYKMMRNFAPGGCWALKQAVAKGEKDPPWPDDFDRFGTYLYGWAGERGTYMEHRSLRGDQPQWGLDGPSRPFARGRGKARGRGGEARGRGGKARGRERGRRKGRGR